MTLDEFVNKYNGQKLDVDGQYPGQCVDLAKAWTTNLGYSGCHGNAIDWKQNASATLTWTDNTPTGVPKAGDLVVWGSGIGSIYGHIAIFVSGNTNSFVSFDQNYPTGSPCKKVTHNYNAVKGWLHPKVLDAPVPIPPPQPPVDQCQTYKDQLDTANAKVSELYSTIDGLKVKQTECKALVDAMGRELANAKTTIENQEVNIQTLITEDAKSQEKIKVLEAQLTQCQNPTTEPPVEVDRGALWRKIWEYLKTIFKDKEMK